MKQLTRQRWSETILLALTITLGMQIVRTLPPYLQYLLGDRLHWGAGRLGLVGVLVFSTGFLVAWLLRRFGLGHLFTISAGGLGLLRLGMQLWTGEPVVDMALMLLGSILFILFLPVALVVTRQVGRSDFVQAILLGLVFDTTLLGLFRTYDFIWQTGYIPLALTTGLVLLQWVLLRVAAAKKPPPLPQIELTFLGALPWLAVGPFFFLQLLVFQNQARLTALTGWSLPVVFGWVLATDLLGLVAVTWWRSHRVGAALLGVILAASLWPFENDTALVSALLLLLGYLSSAGLLSVTLRSLEVNTVKAGKTTGSAIQTETGLRNITVVHGLSMLLLVSFIFAYYVTFSLKMPYQRGWLLPLAGLIIGLCGFVATLLEDYVRSDRKLSTLFLLLPWSLMVLPVTLLLTPSPAAISAVTPSPSLRIMTYNVHNGFNTAGHLDLEALAQVIETQEPDVIALQEISRGWVINGSVDMFEWLARRLKLPYGFFIPSSDALWGQAVLSRYPILVAARHPLPPSNLPMPRSFGYFQLDVGRSQPLHLLNTHLQHGEENGPIRHIQIESILSFLAGHNLTHNLIVAGDLNATPGTPEIERLYDWGFRDPVLEANLVPENTFPSIQPDKRFDYILISPGFLAGNVTIPYSTASDHLGIAVTVTNSE